MFRFIKILTLIFLSLSIPQSVMAGKSIQGYNAAKTIEEGKVLGVAYSKIYEEEVGVISR